MKIALAQTKSLKGKLPSNIQKHIEYIEIAAQQQANLIVFPELSLTSYEPTLAKKLAIAPQDHQLELFQKLSNEKNISIALGMPTKNERDAIFISMLIFQAHQVRQIYSKQYLHTDELDYFCAGNEPYILNIENQKITAAICYESLLPQHIAQAINDGSTIYLASVAKPKHSLEKAFKHYAEIAKKYQITVLMVNSIGHCDNFESAGKSAAWNKHGQLIAQLEEDQEGLLLVDIEA